VIRFAIFTAVSTKPQVEGDSLTEQESLCRAAALARGWQETAGPFVVRGESRTRWVSLDRAQEEIINPDGSRPIKEALDCAQAGKIDVLICFSFDRFRDLLMQAYITLKFYRCQLCSLSEAFSIIPPEEFSPYTDDAKAMIIAMFQAKSTSEISGMQRRHRLGMPGRITKKGLPPNQIPYGYHRPKGFERVSDAVPVQDPLESQWVVTMKDMYLAGQSLDTIAKHLTANGIPAPEGAKPWGRSTVRFILRNPYYSGVVRWRHTHTIHDPRTGHDKTSVAADATTGTGAHVPLWDAETYQAILAEMSRRSEKSFHGPVRTYPLSNLLICGTCGAPMRHNGREPKKGLVQYICRNYYPGDGKQHMRARDGEICAKVADELVRQLPRVDSLNEPAGSTETEQWSQALQELANRRARVEMAYEKGEYNLEKLSSRTGEIDRQAETIKAKLAEAKRIALTRQEFVDTALALSGHLNDLPRWMIEDDPATVNRTLHVILSKIVVFADRIELNFK
jgi:DNA invertase Pin-like site-specific DNA recombinase